MKTSRLWMYKILTAFLPENKFYPLKASLLRWCGAKVGENVRINSSANIRGCGELVVGNDVWIGPMDFISAVHCTKIEIGAHCDLGPQVMILTGSHKIDVEGEHIAGGGDSKSVIVGEGCWLGARSTVMPGVTLHAHTVLAAGAVATKNTDCDYSLMAGVPAQKKKVYK